jgi:hypothetical protein
MSGDQKRESDLLRLGLQAVLNHHADVRDQILIFHKSSKSPYPLPSLRPQFLGCCLELFHRGQGLWLFWKALSRKQVASDFSTQHRLSLSFPTFSCRLGSELLPCSSATVMRGHDRVGMFEFSVSVSTIPT